MKIGIRGSGIVGWEKKIGKRQKQPVPLNYFAFFGAYPAFYTTSGHLPLSC